MNKHLFRVLCVLILVSLVLAGCKQATASTPTPTVATTSTPNLTATPTIVPQGTQIIGGEPSSATSFETAAWRVLNYADEWVCFDNHDQPSIIGMTSKVGDVEVREIWFKPVPNGNATSYLILHAGERTELWAMGGDYGYETYTHLARNIEEIQANYANVTYYIDPIALTVDCHLEDLGLPTPTPVITGYSNLYNSDILFVAAVMYYPTGKGAVFTCLDTSDGRTWFEYGEYPMAGEIYKIYHYAPNGFMNHILRVENDGYIRYFQRLDQDDWSYASQKSIDTIEALITEQPASFVCGPTN